MTLIPTYLISPLVDHRHVDVVNKNCHFLASWWTVCCTHSLVHVTLHCALFEATREVYSKKSNYTVHFYQRQMWLRQQDINVPS